MADLTDAEIIKLLKSDPLLEAERQSGKSYKDDEATMSLGFMFQLNRDTRAEKALTDIGDSTFIMDWLAYCEFVEQLGFGLMIEDFNKEGTESIRIYYHEKDGLLLRADSCHGDRNAADVYYNWRPNFKPESEWKDPNKAEYIDHWTLTSSGSFCVRGDEKTWVGHHDAREALALNMRQLRENGTFIPKWRNTPFLWLAGHWEDTDEKEYQEINVDRIERLPQWVQDNLKGK
jgi:hypothetical protein